MTTIPKPHKKDDNYSLALNRVPDEIKPIFEKLVSDYRTHSMEYYGKAFVSYAILADLVLDGWRLSAKPISKD